MAEAGDLALFMVASAALLLVPGPAILYIVARGVEQGPRAGLVSALGISFGTLAHVAAAAIGLSAVLASSVVAFQAVKYVGAAYLVYLGLEALRNRAAPQMASPSRFRGHRRLFWQAALVNLTNPKTAVFFLSFLPQFVDPGRGDAVLQVLALGAVYVAMALVTDGAYAILSGTLAGWLRANPRARALQRWASGTTLVGLGVATAASGE